MSKNLDVVEPVNTILIPMEEYKELLIIKGKYEQLKEYAMPYIYPTTIRYNGEKNETFKPPYKVTCAEYVKGDL